MNFKRTFFVVSFLTCFLSVCFNAESKTLFYQPQLRDASFTADQWSTELRNAHEAGYTSIVIQWTKYGSTILFDKPPLASLFAVPEAQLFTYWIGLYLPDNYYALLEKHPEQALTVLKNTLTENTILKSTLQLNGIVDWVNIEGWYLPTELTSAYMPERMRREIIKLLFDWKHKTQDSIGISYFIGTKNNTKQTKKDIKELVRAGFIVFLQKSNGLSSKPNIEGVLSSLPCEHFLVHEHFSENKEGVFTLNPDFKEEHSSCHSKAYFSLRYLPASMLKR
jgi:hypothetical protein